MPTSPFRDDLKFSPSRPTWAEIDLAALRSNRRAVCAGLRANVGLLAVIKANAYGHGAVPIAQTLLESDSSSPASSPVRMFGVASVDEGRELREAGIQTPILLLSAILPAEARAAVQFDLLPTVFTREVAQAVHEAGAAAGRVVAAHLKIDTGMGRLGVWHREAPAFHRWLQTLASLRIEGIYTHFACADEADEAMTREQVAAFEAALHECGISPHRVTDDCATDGGAPREVLIHAANSAATLRYGQAHFDLVRPGLALYGPQPAPDAGNAAGRVALQPVMTLKSRVTALKTVAAGASISYGATWRARRTSRIATVPVGYADGYARCLSGHAHVLLRGVCCPVAGRVTMDQILIDCTDLAPDVALGEVVTLWGRGLPVENVAAWARTIPYEILCGVAHRVPRVYVNR